MPEFYPEIRWVHIAAVIASGSLFVLRGAGVLAGARWPMWAPLRHLSYTIDIILLIAALMVFLFIIGVVRDHHPLGVFTRFLPN